MSMSSADQNHIEAQIRKRYPDLQERYTFTEQEGDRLYSKCYEVYNYLGGKPQDWVLHEQVDMDTRASSWVWRRKA